MEILQVDPSNRRQVRDFLRLPARLYHGDPLWVPPLEMEERLRLDPGRHPFYRHSQAGFFLAYRQGEAVARLAVLDNRLHNQHNRSHTAFFTLFESEDDHETAGGLFAAGADWARRRGLDRMFGPRGMTALDGLGLLVKGFEHLPPAGLPYNPPYYAGLIEALGFTKVDEIASGSMQAVTAFPPRIHELAERIRVRRGLTIARFNTRGDLRRALKHLKELYNGALEGTQGGTPLTDAEIKSLADQMLWFADPRLIKIVMKDERPVGFLLAYPDIARGLQRTRGRLLPFGWLTLLGELRRSERIDINGAGMIAEYRGSGGTAILYSEMFHSITQNPRCRQVEVIQIGMENEKMMREMENFGVDFNKIHRTYAIPLDPAGKEA